MMTEGANLQTGPHIPRRALVALATLCTFPTGTGTAGIRV